MALDYNKAVDITKRYQAEIDKITGRYIDEMKTEFGENYIARDGFTFLAMGCRGKKAA